MELLETMNKQEVREFFSKGWITHDAMWLYHVIQEIGIEKANEINRAAVKSMAAVEINRILKMLGKKGKQIESFEEFREVFSDAFTLIKTDFMKTSFSFHEGNIFRGGFAECFAHQGVSMLGVADTYECGVIVRIETWIETMGLKYERLTDFDKCMMQETGKCQMDYRVLFE